MAGRLEDGDDLNETHEINVTPFIDVMLVLLIIFMVAAPLSTVDVPVDLPVSSAKPNNRPDKPIFLTVKSDLSLAFGNDTIARGQMASALDATTGSDRNQRVFLRADKTVPYGELMQVMNLLRAAGYLKVALVGLEEWINAAIGPVSEEIAPTPPVEEVKQTKVEDIPPLDEAPLAPEPEVAFEKVTPTETVEEKQETPQEMQAQSNVASIAAAPPPIEADVKGDRPAAPHQGASRKPSQAQVSWQKSLHLHLNKHKRYPGEARNRRIEGVVSVQFSIDRYGRVTDTRVLKSSGSPLLDEEAIAMLARSSPLPAPPDETGSDSLTMSLPVQFNIR